MRFMVRVEAIDGRTHCIEVHAASEARALLGLERFYKRLVSIKELS